MNRKYLDDIGYTNRHDMWNSDDPRQEKWSREREIYGFDERETWALDHAFACWLYERLKMYLEIDAVNLDFHKFDIDGETLTQNEVINRILALLEESFKNSENASKYDESCDNIAEAARYNCNKTINMVYTHLNYTDGYIATLDGKIDIVRPDFVTNIYGSDKRDFMEKIKV